MSIADANIVIVGGGPCGLLTAAMLHKQGIPCTVLERENSGYFDISRAYTQMVFYRGRRVLAEIPELHDAVSKRSVHLKDYHFVHIRPDGEPISSITPMPDLPDGNPEWRLLRASLADTLRKYCIQKNVNVVMGANVTGIEKSQDDKFRILVRDKEKGYTLTTRLLIACDGSNSVVIKELQRLYEEGQICSSKGFAEEKYMSASVGLYHKTTILNLDFFKYIKQDIDFKEDRYYFFHGKEEQRDSSSVWRTVVFPIHPGESESCCGFPSYDVVKKDNPLLNIQNVEDGYQVFQENFPQLDVRKCISPENMQSYISAKPVVFGPVRRCKSLVAYAGNAGAVVLGDAAHSFPPELGQGVNAAFEDVGVLMNMFEKCTDVCDVLRAYENEREEDISSLMRMLQYGAPYQYGQNKVGAVWWKINTRVRSWLAKWFPRVFYPQIIIMTCMDLRYREIMRRADATTRRVWVAIATVVIVPLATVLIAWVLKRVS